MIDANPWTFEATHHFRALNRDVLAVAVTRLEGPNDRTHVAWKAYIGAVPGYRHDDERQKVANEGGPLAEAVARAIFPEFKELPYAR